MQDATLVDRRSSEQRLCVADFMDQNPEVFASPQAAKDWGDLVRSGAPISGRDRQSVDKALGMLTGIFRSAQTSLGSVMSLSSAWDMARSKGLPDFEPNAMAMKLAQTDPDDEEAVAYARAVTVYQECVSAGVLQGDELARCVDETLDRLPGSSPVMRSLLEAAKRIAQIDIDHMLSGE